MTALPTPRPELATLAREWGLSTTAATTPLLERLSGELLELLEDMPSAPPPRVLAARRDAGAKPSGDEDPFNAIVRSCHVVADDPAGPLAGMRLAVKDSFAIAGVPLTLGSDFLDGFVPDRDAVAVERALRAGAEIVAVANMDALAYTGGGHTSASGPIRNPHDLARSAGGSSGGSAAALHLDGVDAALGTDQAGSVRVPAAWCGVLGLKPTHGRIPYDGIAGIDPTFDHVGPLARTVADLAMLTDALTGASDATEAVQAAPAGLQDVRIGLVRQAIGPDTDTAVTGAIHEVADQLRSLGATVREVSLPEHATAGPIVFASVIEGLTATLAGGGNGYGHAGAYWPELADAVADGLRHRADTLPHEVKIGLLLGSHLRNTRRGATYARAQTARTALRHAYDTALQEVDVLLMPTTPTLPFTHDDTTDAYEKLMRGWNVLANTSPTDMTGHPALSMPAAQADGLPTGAMLISPHGSDGTLLKHARTFEGIIGWPP